MGTLTDKKHREKKELEDAVDQIDTYLKLISPKLPRYAELAEKKRKYIIRLKELEK